MTTAAQTPKVAVVTEEDLLKSIKDLETKTDPATTTVTDPPTPKVETVGSLAKSVADTVKEKGSDGLKKVLDVSDHLREFAGLVGTHVDAMLDPMQKSIQAGAERDLAFIKVLVDLKKSIEDNTAAIKAFGDQPGTAKTPPLAPTTTSKEVLSKAITPAAETAKPATPEKLKREVTLGLEKLAKSFPPNSNEGREYITAAIQFETTGKISDFMLNAARGAIANPPKAA